MADTNFSMWTITEAYEGIWRVQHLCKCHGTVHRGRYDRTILKCDYCKEDIPQEIYDAALLAPYIEFPVSGIVDVWPISLFQKKQE